MKVHYHPETDSLYIELSPRASTDSKEVATGLIVDLDEHGNVVGFDIDRASTRLDLHTLEADSLPISSVRVA